MRIRDWSSDVCSSDLVWYDHDMKKNEGTKWLRDVRPWWRASGRSMSFPAKGVTGATRAPGTHKISFSRAQLGAANPGDDRSAERRDGKEGVRTGRYRWTPHHIKTQNQKNKYKTDSYAD